MNAKAQHNSLLHQVIFAMFCVVVICAGLVFILDQQRTPYHPAIGQNYEAAEYDLSVGTLNSPGKSDRLSDRLHQMYLDQDVDLSLSIESVVSAHYKARNARTLESYLIWAVKNHKSVAYIDTLVNSAAARGEISIPDALIAASGGFDTRRLLRSIVGPASRVDVATKVESQDGQRTHSLQMPADRPAPMMINAKVDQSLMVPEL